ncbi:Putative lysine-specific demethylase JMJD5 [Cytospora mali]|uniref:Lysine-specific demethylase JMJD5 n=1 Tax=Cytospora mali TaxID=578113 RepID=A0A194UN12_CYTMA|nr:Putative lysine-specific demethylase JMJD5 [Valsa mali var. pyri (nom. inval.)]
MMLIRRVSRLVQSRSWKGVRYRSLHSSDSAIRRVTAVDEAHDMIDVQYFRDQAFDAGKPLLMKRQRDSASRIPAIDKWFGPMREVGVFSEATALTSHPTEMTATKHLEAFSLVHVPYELMYPQLCEGGVGNEAVDQFIQSLESENDITTPTVEGILPSLLRHQLSLKGGDFKRGEHIEQRLLRLEAPLALLIAALRYNSRVKQADRLRQLYIAQASLDDLPEELVNALPTPSIVEKAGKGDIYASSIWLGLEPTYTPLHRDPNPNLFIQLCSSKTIRLLPPSQGDSIFHHVQLMLGRHGGNSRIRGTEMMEGPERTLLYKAIWEEPDISLKEVAIHEVDLKPGDALFIPKGWWHSVKSGVDDGRLNGSVNWWFR